MRFIETARIKLNKKFIKYLTFFKLSDKMKNVKRYQK